MAMNPTTDQLTLGGFDLDDPFSRWRLTDATRLPDFGAPDSPSPTIPGVDGVLPLAPLRATPITIKVGVLATQGHSAMLIGHLRSLMHRPVLPTLEWRPRWGGVWQGAARFSSSLSLEFPGIGDEVLVSFTLEVPAGYFEARAWTILDLPGNGVIRPDLLNSPSAPVCPYVVVRSRTAATPVVIEDHMQGKSYTFPGMGGEFVYLIDMRRMEVTHAGIEVSGGTEAWIQSVDTALSHTRGSAGRQSREMYAPPGGIRLGRDPFSGVGHVIMHNAAQAKLFTKFTL